MQRELHNNHPMQCIAAFLATAIPVPLPVHTVHAVSTCPFEHALEQETEHTLPYFKANRKVVGERLWDGLWLSCGRMLYCFVMRADDQYC